MSDEKQKKRALAEILEAMADEEEHEAAVAEVEAMSPEELRKEYEARPRAKAKEPKEPKESNVVPLAPRRRTFLGVKVTWLVAAALVAIAASTVGVRIATRDDGTGGDTRVATAPCQIYRQEMTLDGTITKSGDAFVLDLGGPPNMVCGPNSEHIAELPLVTTPASPDLAPLVGKRARVQGKVLERDAGISPLVMEVGAATRL